MSNFTRRHKFNFVVFPNLLEHMPVEQHSNIFQTITELTTPAAVVLINIPESNYLNWVRIDKPARCHIIYQSLSMQYSLNNSYLYRFKLYSMNHYQLHYTSLHYLSIMLKKNMELKSGRIKSYYKRALKSVISKL